MKFLDEFRDPRATQQVLAALHGLLADAPRPKSPWQIMEVCGGHTHAIYRYGLDKLIPDCIEFLHGPGCPVCVLPPTIIDTAFALARMPDICLCSYGDALRVPGTHGSLQNARSLGADVRAVYSAMDAVNLARVNPHRQIVFFAIGFETTAPATASALLQARRDQLDNFLVLSHHITIMPPLVALLEAQECRIDAFIGPGHLSTITGCKPYHIISQKYQKPLVISGFEPLDLLQSVYMLVAQLIHGERKVQNQYLRAVRSQGNPAARALVNQVFRLAPYTEWRGLGRLPQSGLMLTPAFERFDARRLLPHLDNPDGHELAEPAPIPTAEATQAHCTDVLRGAIPPSKCPLFASACTPAQPAGPLMVSSEGACSAYWQYRREALHL